MMDDTKPETNLILERRCYYCGELILGKRSDAKYCTQKCRQKDYLKRNEDGETREFAIMYVKSYDRDDEASEEKFRKQILSLLKKKGKPSEEKRFDILVNFYSLLRKLLSFVEQFFQILTLEKAVRSDLKKLSTDLSIIVEGLMQSSHSEARNIAFETDFLKNLIRNLVSEMQMMHKTTIELDFHDDLRDEMIEFHAKLAEMMEF